MQSRILAKYPIIYCWLLIGLITGCQKNLPVIQLIPGMTIDQSGIVQSDTLKVTLQDSSESALRIEGTGLIIDFKGSWLDGRRDPTRPDLYIGTGIMVKGKNITIRNLNLTGFKIALYAEEVDSLILENCDFSYNFRQQLGSTREKEDLNDWLYYHHNEADEWKRYGAAVYLKNCDDALIRNIKVTQGQNGIMMTGCNHALIYNNRITFNSGIGIGLYRSSGNRIMHNLLNFNVRGYSHGIYQRGQDSAGLLAYEQSNDNIFAFNSATHSGDGFFLWAGQQSMDSGEGGCNGNIIYRNDFSYAPTNGIEVTFSSNYLIDNIMKECRYGIWGGYSFESIFSGNEISDCQYGIAVEHGNAITISENIFSECNTGIKLWARDKQPEGWGFAEKRNVSSRNYLIVENTFRNNQIPFDITATDSIILRNNKINGQLSDSGEVTALDRLPELPVKLSDGIEFIGQDSMYAGRKFIIVNEWGPYNFAYPLVWLREIREDKYIFALFGPLGNWKINGADNFENGSLKSGTFPNTLTAERINKENSGYIEFEFIGEKFIDQHGQTNQKGNPYHFRFEDPAQEVI